MSPILCGNLTWALLDDASVATRWLHLSCCGIARLCALRLHHSKSRLCNGATRVGSDAFSSARPAVQPVSLLEADELDVKGQPSAACKNKALTYASKVATVLTATLVATRTPSSTRCMVVQRQCDNSTMCQSNWQCV
jgi:hypothetical protein